MDLRINADDQSSGKVCKYWLIIIIAIVAVALLSALVCITNII